MAYGRALKLLLLSCFALHAASLVLQGRPGALIKPYKRELLQDIVCLADPSPILFNCIEIS